ncbi:MAG TPA: aldehyde dehydrogenase family protein [Solirubrobacteraceae bacterium]|nr:aldehyde dehydrogenase family protein [Solirubrobacteraceae bacterium]
MASVEHQGPGIATNGGPASTIAVENPATGEVVGTVRQVEPAELQEMARRGRAAQPAWQALGFRARGEVMHRARKWLFANAERVIETVVSETGKTWEDAQLTDFLYTVTALNFWAKQAERYLADEHVPSWNNPIAIGKKLIVRYEPIGLVGVIGPWNYPIVNSFGDCIPALMAGNSVILKPSEITPLSSLLMEEMLRECGLPPGVFQVASGDGSTGAALIAQVDCVMFTGSTRTGKAVMKAAADAVIPCYLELGGKDPMIVCADADIERAAHAATYYSMSNAGQVCISVERVYVEEPVYDEFVRRVTDNVRQLRQGVPSGEGTVDVGAVIFPPQLEIIDSHVKDAVAKGARVLTGGHPASGPGRFFEPTVLVDVDHSMTCMQEETFGPTLPIMRIRDLDEGIALANESEFGLQASVWTRDVERGEAAARRLQAGVVCVNDAMINYSALNLPMGGWKSSGMGTRHGSAGIRKYCKTQSLFITRRALKREPFMFPYRTGRTRMLRRFFRLLYGR